MICAIIENESELPDNLAAAYQARNQQLREAHLTLAEAVSALTADLTDRRDEVRTLRHDVSSLREQLESLAKHHVVLEGQLQAAYNMKVVRWSAPLRRVVYWWRDRRQ